jgi:ANTAR domain
LLSQPRLSGGLLRWAHSRPAALIVQGGGAVADSEAPDLEYERLKAQLRTMPVIEQAKGIVMAREGCGPEEAFEVLRRTSQQANLKVYVLASFLVEQIAGKAAGLSPGSEPCGEDGEIMAGLLDPERSVARRLEHGSPGG